MSPVDLVAVLLAGVLGVVGWRCRLLPFGLSVAAALGALFVAARALRSVQGHGGGGTTAVVVAVLIVGGAVAMRYVRTRALRVGSRTTRPGTAWTACVSRGLGALVGVICGAGIPVFLGVDAIQAGGADPFSRAASGSRLVRVSLDNPLPRGVVGALAALLDHPVALFPAVAAPGPTETGTPITEAPAVAASRDDVVEVRGSGCGAGALGAGFVVAPGYVATAAHVVAGLDLVTVVSPARRTPEPALVVAFRADRDLAILSVPGVSARTLPLGTTREGELAAFLGYPTEPLVSTRAARIGRSGDISTHDIYGRTVHQTIIWARGEGEPGFSGGPVLNEAGTVVGLVSARAHRFEDGVIVIPAQSIRDILRTAIRRSPAHTLADAPGGLTTRCPAIHV